MSNSSSCETNVKDHDKELVNNTASKPNQQQTYTSDQQTLQALARVNLEDLGGIEDSNGAFAHGPFHQSQKFLLSVIGSPQEEEPKVTHLLANTDKKQNLRTTDQPTFQGSYQASPSVLEDVDGRDGISTLGSFHQDHRSPLPSPGRQQETG